MEVIHLNVNCIKSELLFLLKPCSWFSELVFCGTLDGTMEKW